jgi:uncharacterized membrane protein
MAILLVVLLVATALRFPGLGDLGFVWDEDITALAVQGVHGVSLPTLPSGRIYARALPYTYIAAAFHGLTGDPEFDLRLPGVLFSLLSLMLIALLGKEWGDARAGLLAAALGAVSLWELAVARNARMYPMLACLALAFLCFWSRGFRRRRPGWHLVALATLGLAVLVHDLAATLVVVYAYPLWARWRGRSMAADVRPGLPLLPVAAVAMAGFGMVVPRLLSAFLGRQFPTLDHHAGSLAGRPPASVAGVLSELVRLPPPALWDRPGGPAVMWILLTLGLAALAVGWRRGRLRDAGRLAAAALVTAAVAAHQFVLAAAGVWIMTCGGNPEPQSAPWRRPEVVLGLAVVAVAGLGWGVLGLATAPGGVSPVAVQDLLLAMVDIPQRFWWLLAESFPLLFIVAVVVPLVRIPRGRCPEGVDFLGFIVPALLLATGLGASPSWSPRYIFHLNLILLLLAALQISELFRAMAPGSTAYWGLPAARRLAWGAVAAGLLLLALDVAPPRRIARRLTQSHAWAWPDPIGGPWEGYPFYPDERSPALFVAEHRQPGDRVVAMNWLSFAAYAGPADYWLRSSGYEVQVYEEGEELRDVYTSAVLLPDVKALERVVRSAGESRVWLVTSGLEVARGARVSQEMLAFLAQHEGHVVYHAADGRGKVYVFGQG